MTGVDIMAVKKALGTIQQITDLREIWGHEATDFTPWLADNIDLLNEATGLNLEVLETEAQVGSFSVDILAQDANSEQKAIIENQLEDTNHDHLGKLLTYAAGKDANLMTVKIQDFTGEKGWFMLWHLSVAASGKGCKSIPIFINQSGILRPLAGKRIWSALLDKTRTIFVSEGAPADEDTINMLTEAAQDYAYDTFSEMATEYERQIEENHRKYGYALRLRIEAAEHIGIENIKQHTRHTVTVHWKIRRVSALWLIPKKSQSRTTSSPPDAM